MVKNARKGLKISGMVGKYGEKILGKVGKLSREKGDMKELKFPGKG